MASPTVTVQDGSGSPQATTNGVDVTAGNTLTFALTDVSGVTNWAVTVFGQDELVAPPAVTVNQIAKTATCVAPTGPWSIIYQSQVNGGINANGKVDASLTTTFKVCVQTGGGSRLAASNETFENNAATGWTGVLNGPIRGGAGSILATTAPDNVLVQAAAVGTGTTAARADHLHNTTVGTPVDLGTANAAGSSTSLVRADHVHNHANQLGGSLHALAVSAGAAGFIDGTHYQNVLAILVGSNQANFTYHDCTAGDDTIYVGQNSTGAGGCTKIYLGRSGHTELHKFAQKEIWATGTSGGGGGSTLPTVTPVRDAYLMTAGSTGGQVDQYVAAAGKMVSYEAEFLCECKTTAKSAWFKASVVYRNDGSPVIINGGVGTVTAGSSNATGILIDFVGPATLVATISDGNSWKVSVYRSHVVETV